MKSRQKAHLALLATNIFFAVNFSAVKFLINKGLVMPLALNLMRIGGAVALLWIIAFAKKSNSKIHKKDIWRFIFCALTGIVLNQVLFIKGLAITYSIHASLLMLTTPILIIVFAALFLNEEMNGEKIAGVILGIGGSYLLVTSRIPKTQAANAGLDVITGDMMILLNAVCYTIYFIIVKPLMSKYRSMTVVRMIFSIGLVMVLPFSWAEFNQIQWYEFSAIDYSVLAIIVFCGTFLAYAFNIYGIKILGAAVAGSYIYTQPFFAAVIAMMVLGERITPIHIISAILIFAGVYLANKRSAKR